MNFMTFKSTLRVASQVAKGDCVPDKTKWNVKIKNNDKVSTHHDTTRGPIQTQNSWKPANLATPRLLLRAILRECTYLPDPNARLYLRKHALSRFKAYTLPSKPLNILQDRREIQIKVAREALSQLRRANAGELKVLNKVLHMTYGRIGKRRHELLAPLLIPDNLNNTEQVARKDAASSWPTREQEKDKPDEIPQLTPQLKALLISQLRASPPEVTRAHIKTLAPDIPDKNTWERPMPWKREKNMTKEWYAKTLSRTLVPLEVKEWEDLKGRAVGSIPFEGPIKRRTRAASTRLEIDVKGMVKGHQALEDELSLNDVTDIKNILKRVDDEARGRALTKRFMRKRWSAVFAQCPVMHWDETNTKWIVTWGCDVLLDEIKTMSAAKPV